METEIEQKTCPHIVRIAFHDVLAYIQVVLNFFPLQESFRPIYFVYQYFNLGVSQCFK